MAKIDIARTQINTIKNATQVGENTAARVGEAMGAIVDVFDDYASKAEFYELTRQPGEALPVSETSYSWCLTGDGLCAQSTTCNMRTYVVNAGDVMYLKLAKDSEGVYQFQSSDRVPSYGNTYVVGSPVKNAIDGFVIVPEGATHLIVSVAKTNTTNQVKSTTIITPGELKKKIDDLGTGLREEMSGIDSELSGKMTGLGTELRGEMSEVSSDLNGIKRTYPLNKEGRYNAPADISLKAGVKYTLRAKLAHAPSNYVAPEMRNSSGTKIVDFGSLRNTDTKEVYYTTTEDITLYASIYVPTDSTDAVSISFEIFSGDTISVKVANISRKLDDLDTELREGIADLGTKITEISSDLNGYNEDFALTKEGRYTSPNGIAFKGGKKYTVRATLAHTPSTYVAPDLRTSGGAKIVDFGELKNTDTKEVYYTPNEDITLYASIYVAAGSTDATSVNLVIFGDDTISVKVAEISSKFSFSSAKPIGGSGRRDYVDRFSLLAGEKYFLQSKLSSAPTAYVAVELRDANNTVLATLGEIRDSATHSATYTPTQDVSNAFIHVYSSNSADSEILLSTKFGLVSTFDGEIVGSTRQMDIVSANMEAADKFLQLKRMPRDISDTKGITPLVLLHYSDIHGSVENLQRIVQFYEAYKTKIDDVLNTGDTVYHESTDDFIVPMVPGASSQLLALGNHDAKSGNSQITATACYARYIAPFVAAWGVVQPSDAAANGKCYYYKDYTAAKVRLIVLDCIFWDTAQNTWLAATLADAKTQGLAVVCATHFAGGKVTPFENSWSTLQYDDVSTVINAVAPSTVQAFINDGGEFVCWLSGHGHFDMVGTLDDYPQQLNIAVDTANYGSSSWYSDIQRTRYTKSEDLLNAFSVDTYNKTIRLFRVGADRDSQLRHRGDLLIKYTTLQVLYSD